MVFDYLVLQNTSEVNSSPPEQAGVNCTLLFGKEKYSDFAIPFEIFSRLVLADSTTNQTKIFPGNPTPFG